MGKTSLMELQEQFTSLLQAIGFSENDKAVRWNELKKAYTKEERYYHNLTHLTEMLTCFDHYKMELKSPREVGYAIFYHDFIYKSTRKDNELKSAEHALDILPTKASLDKQLVYDMIIATKDHVSSGTGDESWLIDFDLRILGKDWECYQIYCRQIRKEYRIYPDFLYNPGRKKALLHFLEKKYIFQTQTFRTLYEEKARVNIQNEINQL